MLVLIGSAPSSGSTLLADLLDSSPISVCGKELSLFANQNVYDIINFKKNINIQAWPIDCYKTITKLNHKALHSYGIDESDLIKFLDNASSFVDFTDRFCKYYLALRGKPLNSVVFEKTPENINCINEFLSANPKSYFVYIDRNPIYIYSSIRKRKFTPIVALSTWLISISRYLQNHHHERLIYIKYEDLVQTPFQIAAQIIRRTSNSNIDSDVVKNHYFNNDFRRHCTLKLKTWKYSSYGEIANANQSSNLSPGHLSEIKDMLNCRITKEYADVHNLNPISFVSALKSTGYYNDFVHLTNEVRGKKTNIYNKNDNAFLVRRMIQNRTHIKSIKAIKGFLRPIETF